jgi:hypothetical protein
MRTDPSNTSLADISDALNKRAPASFSGEIRGWLDERVVQREEARMAGVLEAKAERGQAKRTRK